ncbi:MAG TPA: ROK family protein [Kofleriaceae bacterium]|nr:ROK family protein [Kofleriaceae bacterium]
MTSVGIDLGGTNIRLAVYGDDSQVEPLLHRREAVGAERGPEALVERLSAMALEALREAGVEPVGIPVGIGIAAMMRGTEGMVARSPHLHWIDVPFGAMMRARLGPELSVVVDNDVNMITYGEWRAGAGVGARDLLAVYVGTGIGAGLVSAGQLITGASGCAAELGHVKVVLGEDARPCACGLRGCVEAYAGGTYLQQRARTELAGKARSSATMLAGGAEHVNPGHLDEAAASGDAYALELYAEIAPLLGVALANAVTMLNSERLILGGGVLSRTPILREHVLTAFDIATNPPARAAVTVVEAALGDDAGLVGSALLASRRD